MCEVLLFGEPMALFVADKTGSLETVDKYTRSISGAEVNVGIGLTRLGYDVAYITRLGDDILGKFIASFLEKERINTQYITYDKMYRTGIQFKSKEVDGDAHAPYFRKNSAASQITKDILADLDFESVRLIHITGIPLALSEHFRELIFEVIAIAQQKGIYVSFDPNLRMELWDSVEEMRDIVLAAAKQCDLFLPGYNEATLITGTDGFDGVLDVLNSEGIERIIMKVGPEGAIASERDKREMVSGYKVDAVVDTVGAGDGFAAGVLSGILDGCSLAESALRGNAIGALQVMNWSDNEGLPTKKELEKYMREAPWKL